MKLKYYLRGLGTGVLFATIVLFIAYSYRLSDAKLSDSEIKEKALELGMVYGEGETTTSQSGDESETTTVNPTTGKQLSRHQRIEQQVMMSRLQRMVQQKMRNHLQRKLLQILLLHV